PAAAFWALSLAAALRAGGTSPNDADLSSRRRAGSTGTRVALGSRAAGSTGTWFALGSGAAAGMAILIRANLAPVAIVPAAMVVWNSPRRWRSGLMFSLAVIPAAGFIAWLYTYWYGSPLNSGYGS